MEVGDRAVGRSLVDTVTKQTHKLLGGGAVDIVSAAALAESSKRLVVPPAVAGECYVVRLSQDDPPSLCLLNGQCTVNGTALQPQAPAMLLPGCFVVLGSGRCLQYVCSDSAQQQPRRVLPPTPGKAVTKAPPSKPQRLKKQDQRHSSPAPATPADQDSTLDSGVRQRLQRIAAEVSARVVGYAERKPPPPYEAVGNSIAYQLLHQQQHKMVTSALIDALYPALKENELKDSSLLQMYSTYLQAFKEALVMPASLQCMLPADLPTCDFIVDTLLHLCCMPHMIALAEKQGELWCHLLAFFSQSEQNQIHLTAKRHPSKVLSCMHLNIMAPKLRFQQHGWSLLANTVTTPIPAGGKPVLSESSLTLALSLTESQLAANSSDISLVVAIVRFLAQVATAAKTATNSEDKAVAYTAEQGKRILALFQEKFVLRQVMIVPPHLRSEGGFEAAYSALVKALVPVRGQVLGGSKFSRISHSYKQTEPDTTSAPTTPPENGSSLPQHEFSHSFALETRSETSLLPEAQPVPVRSSSCSDLLQEETFRPRQGHINYREYSIPGSIKFCVKDAISSSESGESNISSQIENPPSTIQGSQVENSPSAVQGPQVENSPLRIKESLNFPMMVDESENPPSILQQSKLQTSVLDSDSVDASSPESQQDGYGTPVLDHSLDGATGGYVSGRVAGQEVGVSCPNVTGDSTGHANISETALQHSDVMGTSDTTEASDETKHPQPNTVPVARKISFTPEPSPRAEDSDLTNTAALPLANSEPSFSPPVEEVTSPPPTPSTAGLASPPLTPNTASLAEDVKELLDILNAPLEVGHTGSSAVKVPTLSRYNRYYRHSIKKASFKLKEVSAENGKRKNSFKEENTVDAGRAADATRDVAAVGTEHVDTDGGLKDGIGNAMHVIRDGDVATSEDDFEDMSNGNRSLWRDRLLSNNNEILSPNSSEMFEVSGMYFSSRYSALEEVESGHGDICIVLQSRLELLEAVATLWAQGKGLQAATNLLQGCFSEDNGDGSMIFADTLQGFLQHQSPWTLAVCLVLLPTLRQLLSSPQTQNRCLEIICDVILMIVRRFSELILACRGSPKKRSKLSSAVDREQQLICYRELHSIQQVLHTRLNSNPQDKSAGLLRKVHAALKPFRQTAN